ncbi:MAG TPA: M20/M25/M40 family metallo-hydrolase [Caulobacteraceae bacterium]|jgi:acetylornithine deacetylase/succinyl-diaminopimelate desuccinylase-like protein
MAGLTARLAGVAAAALAFAAQAAPPQWQAKQRELFDKSIALRSVAGRPEVTQLAEYLAGEFRKGGFPAADIQLVPIKGTASLVVRYRGTGASGKKPILLISHMDVVDALPSDWTKDPFKLTEEGGYFYGRGTSDIKSGVVTLAALFLWLKADGYRPDRDLIIAFTGDEETEGEHMATLVRDHRPLIDAEYALNSDAGGGGFTPDGKPLGFGFQTSEKMYADYTLTVHNKGGHSSAPRADNAIYQLAAALTRVSQHRFSPMINDTTRAYFRAQAKTYGGELGAAMLRFADNPNDRAAADRIEAEPGEVGSTRTTCVATMLSGGHAHNALPQTASANVNCRVFPGVSAEATLAELKRVAADPGVEIAITGTPDPSPPSPLRDDVLGAFTKAVRARHPESPVIPSMSAGATDGAYLRAGGVPTYGVDGAWGVVPDDMRAHGRDERLPVKAFYEDLDHWRDMVTALAGPPGK